MLQSALALYPDKVAVNDDLTNAAGQRQDRKRGFSSSLLIGLGREILKYVIAFAVGTGAGAIVCWYYGIPLVFSIAGGILVVAIALALSSDSLFD